VKVITCTQRSPEWHAARLGRLTGSRVADAFATLKSKGEAASRRNLRVQLVLERITGVAQESGFVSPDMERGAQLEDEARAAYEAETGIVVQPVGFIAHDTLMAGCSPDGVPHDGLIEIKAPKAATHLDYVRDGLPNEYRLQILHGLWLTGASWADFVSYHPTFPEPLRLKITRLYAKDLDLAAHELNVRLFLDEVEKEEVAVRALAGEVAVA
jgi:putative phage-type endonuclease